VRGRLTLGGVLALMGLAATLSPQVLALDESWGLGVLFWLRGAPSPPSSVVVVGIDRDAAAALGETSELDTWSRSLHARLLERLDAAGASVVAFDLVFDDPRDSAGDAAFAAAIARAGNVVLAERTEADNVALGSGSEALIERRIAPLAAFDSAALATAPFVLPRVPIRVGQFWTFGLVARDAPSLPAVALQAHLLPHYESLRELTEEASAGATSAWPAAAIAAADDLVATMRVLRATFVRSPELAAALASRVSGAYPTDRAMALRALVDLYSGASSRYLNFYGPARAVTTIPYDRVLAGERVEEVGGKVVFVGLTERRESAQEDDFYSVFSEPTGRNLSGVEIGATAFANLLDGRALRTLSMPAHLALVLAFGLTLGAAVWHTSTARAAAVCLGGAGGYVAVAMWLFASESFWLPLVVPVLLQALAAFGWILASNYRALSVQRERVRTALGYYVPQALAHRLAEQSVSLGAGRELLHGTCLYSDAERYTTIAEVLSPTDLAVLMNDYYGELFRVVEQYGGEISDTAGDSMVAVWASARPDPVMRQRAASAAAAMLKAVDAFNARQPLWRLPTRIGLESGELLIGNIGAEQRYEYRAIGDIVNTAARLQELNRHLGTRALISAAALNGTTGLRTRALGQFQLRGKRSPVIVHELTVDGLSDEDLGEFARALAAFRQAEWQEAGASFAALTARLPQDGPSRFYADLADRYRREPPPFWQGAVPAVTR
jgi:adenylate cyclase